MVTKIETFSRHPVCNLTHAQMHCQKIDHDGAPMKKTHGKNNIILYDNGFYQTFVSFVWTLRRFQLEARQLPTSSMVEFAASMLLKSMVDLEKSCPLFAEKILDNIVKI